MPQFSLSPRTSLSAACFTLLAILPLSAAVNPPAAVTPSASPNGTQEVAASLGTIPNKAFPLTSKLVLPYFEVDTLKPGGATVLYGIRNESTSPIDVVIQYFEVDSPFAPQHSEQVTLVGKQIKTVNIRDVPDLEVDPDGRKRGYVRFEVVGGSNFLAGDFFRVDPDEEFATGYRLVNADSGNSGDERCSIFTFRFLKGGAFTGGTEIYYWLDMTTLPSANTISYAIYDEAGNLVGVSSLANTDRVASRVSIDQLLVGPAALLNAGAIEMQFDGVLGHVAGTISASGKFSVGFEGVCRE